MQMYKVNIDSKWIGDGQPCFVIAEAGINHNGKIELAKQLIDEAKKAGADAVKFQTFKSEGVTAISAELAGYQKKNIGTKQSQIDMLRKYEFEYDTFREMKEYCDKRKIVFLSTPHSYDAIDFLDDLVPAYKISSGDITNIPAIEKIAKKGKPVIISTGMATLEEIRDALDTVRNAGNDQIILLQCVTSYPSNLEDQNIEVVRTLRMKFDVLTGFSDHTMGLIAPIVAVSVGACLIEKHFTLDRTLEGPDHKASLEPSELKEMIDSIRNAQAALGDGIKRITDEEKKNRVVSRKSLVASRDISRGTIITRDMIEIKRPETGIRPKRLKDILGSKANSDIKEDDVITNEMILWKNELE
jgi:N,N'-diacetyllegionaminate synthase